MKAAIGVPGNLNLDAEIYVSERVAIEVGYGIGFLGSYVNAGVRWRPNGRCHLFWVPWE